MHAAMLAGDLEPHYLVARGVNGLVDALFGTITMLYVAVLQRRAFFMTFGDGASYEWAFEQPSINWTWCAAGSLLLVVPRLAYIAALLLHHCPSTVRQQRSNASA